ELINFRDGRRSFPQMIYFTQLRTGSDLAEIARYFADQRLPYPPPARPSVGSAMLERGRKLVREGNDALHVPACQTCHGKQLLGVEPVVPGLLGVSPDYLQGQLGAWRSGIRKAQAPDCMASIVKRLRPEDIGAAAAWLASQPVSSGASPAASFEEPPPI